MVDKNKEKVLLAFIRTCPLTIEYGCHTLELKKDECKPGGYTFQLLGDEGNGLRLKIQ